MVLVIFYLNQTWNHELLYLFVIQINPLYDPIIITCWVCMTKKSNNSWFRFGSNVASNVAHIGKRNFLKFASYVIFLDHFVLLKHIGNLIIITKIL